MIRIEFTNQMIAELSYERYHHPHPKVQHKMEVLYFNGSDKIRQQSRHKSVGSGSWDGI